VARDVTVVHLVRSTCHAISGRGLANHVSTGRDLHLVALLRVSNQSERESSLLITYWSVSLNCRLESNKEEEEVWGLGFGYPIAHRAKPTNRARLERPEEGSYLRLIDLCITQL